MQQQVDERHERFKRRLWRSSPAVFAVGLWLHRKGYAVEIPGLRVAPTAAEYLDYQDDGDLFCFVYRNYDVRHRYEVRWLDSTLFSSRDDWPYGDRVFVDRVAKVEKAAADVIAWINVSADFKAITVVPRNTRDKWEKVEVFNKVQNRHEWTYSCPKRFADFEVL